MWHTFAANEHEYLIKIKENNSKLQLLVTDLEVIWSESLNVTELCSRFQEINVLLELNQDEIIEHVSCLIRTFEVPEKFETTENGIFLQIASTVENEFKKRIYFNLTRDSQKMFYSELTVPLIQTIQYLEDKEQQLSNLLIKKDAEIREYQLEKGHISRGSRVTESFKPETTKSLANNFLLLGVFSKSDAFKSFNKKHDELFKFLPEMKIERRSKKRKLKPYTPKSDNSLVIENLSMDIKKPGAETKS